VHATCVGLMIMKTNTQVKLGESNFSIACFQPNFQNSTSKN
jgi:hypothetical protein